MPRPRRQSLSPSSSSSSNGRQSSRDRNTRRREAECAVVSLSVKSLAGEDFHQHNALPAALRDLQRDLKQAVVGKPVISSSRKAEILAADDTILETHFFPDYQGPESPAYKDVLKICRRAGKYAVGAFDEATWRVGVVFPLLDLAIPDDGGLIVVPCTPARVVDKNLLPSAYDNGKMVDFCLAIDPSWNDGPDIGLPDTDADEALRRLQELQPHRTINHTDYQPLSEKPIALSITVKRASGNMEEAQTQLRVWQFAHWQMLRRLASIDFDGHDPTTVEGLPFLPGVYIVGHQWRFSATTCDMFGSVTQWIDVALGDTSSPHGIYCIVWGLRRIASYLTEDYWDWFQTRLLRLNILYRF
ncbi:hypothetical protein MAPG_09813 [Magnaporthiopsis poae ATCC 64411]|uniref:PD-(D/E)XK nuclease-like domain-containing protein n=1 Tax=Magnaporthiopsis poae (strain ATCC 64411 / 73-15) TaxID=644358 RepID=A0A0C4EAX6_MAGP6|nr:hypothetical protein MAPG_09813 [Magnaporthiopsis poae ATCC 64411]